jgi:hypothetical protein
VELKPCVVSNWKVSAHSSAAETAASTPLRGKTQSYPKMSPTSALADFSSTRNLPDCKKSLHQLALTANNHPGESFEPFAFRNFGFAIQPIGKRSELISRNLPLLDSIEQMIEQCWRKIVSRPPPVGARPLPRGCTGHVAVPNRSILPPNLRHAGVGRRSRGRLLREPSLVPLDR